MQQTPLCYAHIAYETMRDVVGIRPTQQRKTMEPGFRWIKNPAAISLA
jgi:hypothetical protein